MTFKLDQSPIDPVNAPILPIGAVGALGFDFSFSTAIGSDGASVAATVLPPLLSSDLDLGAVSTLGGRGTAPFAFSGAMDGVP